MSQYQFTTYLGFSPDEIRDALDWAARTGWIAKPPHEPAVGDRYVAWDDHAELILVKREPACWLALRKDTKRGDEDVWRVNHGALAEFYRYVRDQA